jgi:sigma-B regulation protein RsbU (phosphoserine phosphatase)
MFATIFYAILDPQTGVMTYINGGHEPPIISGPEGIKTTLETTGPAVGAYPDLEFKTGTVTLEPEDTLLVYTDGVIDAQSKGGEAFTKTALLNLMQSPPVSAVDLIDKIQTRLRQHTVSGYPYDDITMLAIRRTE